MVPESKGTSNFNVELGEAAHRELKALAASLNVSMKHLVKLGINMVFKKHGIKEIPLDINIQQ